MSRRNWQQPDDQPYPYDAKRRIRSIEILLLGAFLVIIVVIIATWLHAHHGCIVGLPHKRIIEADVTGSKPAYATALVCESP